MKKKFYYIRSLSKKGVIQIAPRVEFEEFELLEKNTPLINNNIFDVTKGKVFYDIIEFSGCLHLAISEKTKKLLIGNLTTGWDCFPIEINNYTEKKYYGFQVLAKAGPITNLEKVNNYRAKYIEFQYNSWNGEDIFNLENTLLIVCTTKVKEFLERELISNIKFEECRGIR